MKIPSLKIFGDSKFVNQRLMLYEVKKIELLPYFKYASKLLTRFDTFSIEHVPQKESYQVDALANLASTLAVSDGEFNVHICQWMVISLTLEVKDEDKVNVVFVYEIDNDNWH